MELCTLPADMIIFEQGARADYLYILVEGEVIIRFKPYDGPPLTIARIEAGNVFGWSSALNRRTYSSAAITVSESTALRLLGSELQHLCERCPSTGAIFLERLAGVISERLKNSHQEILALLSNSFDIDSECWRRINANGRKKRIHA